MEFQRINKKGLEFKNMFFSIIVVSLAVVSIGLMITAWNDKYDSSITSDFGVYDKSDDLATESQSYEERLTSGDADPGENSEASTYRGVYGILGNIYNSFNVAFGEDGMIDNVIKNFGLPSYIRKGIITIVMGAIAFSLMAVVFRLARSSA